MNCRETARLLGLRLPEKPRYVPALVWYEAGLEWAAAIRILQYIRTGKQGE